MWGELGEELELGELVGGRGAGDWFRSWEGRRKRGNRRLFLLASFDIVG